MRQSTRVALSALAAWSLSFLCVRAQTTPGKCDPRTLHIIKTSVPWNHEKPGAMILDRECEASVDSKGNLTEIIHMLGKVYDSQARSDYSQIVIPFNEYYENIVLDFARTIRDDGTVQEVPKDVIQIKTTPDGSGSVLYTDNRFLSFALFGLDDGVSFEYQVTITQKRAKVEGQWFENHPMGYYQQTLSPPYIPRLDPVFHSSYRLRVPHGSKFLYHTSCDSISPVITQGEKTDEYRWEASKLAGITIENDMPPMSDLRPEVSVTSFERWNQIDAWASQKLLPSNVSDRDLKVVASSLMGSLTSREKKIEAAFDYVQTHIQYVYADLERGGYTPHSVHDILASRFGDCKDQTFLLISLLRSAGIEAYPALVSPLPYDEFVAIPTPSFTHVITYIPGQKGDVWLDPTAGVTPYPRLLFSDQNRTAFIVNGKGGSLVRTPGSGFWENSVSVDFHTQFENRDAIADMTILTAGAESDLIKGGFRQTSREQLQEYFRSLISSKFPKAVVDTVEVTDVRNSRKSFGAFIRFRSDTLWRRGMESFAYGSLAGLSLNVFANLNVQYFPAVRHNNIAGRVLFTVSGVEQYAPPASGMLPLTLPPQDSLSNDYSLFYRKFARLENGIAARWVYNTKTMKIPREEYQRFVADARVIQEKAAWQVTFFNPELLWERALANDGPASTVKQATELITEDSTNALAFLLRGKAQLQLDHLAAGLTDFDYALRLVPGNVYAHLWDAGALLTDGRPKEALAHLEKAIRIDSAFVGAYVLRGGYYYDNGLYAQALADFRKACESDPENQFALQLQGRALNMLGRFRNALEAFRKAQQIDSTNGMNYVGIGDAFLGLESYAQSKSAYLEAVSRQPRMALAYAKLGWLSFVSGDDKQCIEYSRQAFRLDSSSLFPRYSMALAHLRLGNTPTARRIFSEAQLSFGAGAKPETAVAIWQLKSFVLKGIHREEARAILKDFFGVSSYE